MRARRYRSRRMRRADSRIPVVSAKRGSRWGACSRNAGTLPARTRRFGQRSKISLPPWTVHMQPSSQRSSSPRKANVSPARGIRLSLMSLAALLALTTFSSAPCAEIPKTMRAAAIDHPGGPEVLTLHTLPVPDVGADEVLIAVHTAGVAIWDADIRQRLAHASKPQFPFVMGSDGAGLVAAVGSKVTRFKVGDAVYAYCWDNPKGGFYAEYAAVPTSCVAH